MPGITLVAIGGNSLIRAGQRGTIAQQRENAAATAAHLVHLVQRGERLVLTHGNGPQVGAQLLRSELSAAQVSPEPLDVCGADTQGAIGYLLEQALERALAAAGLRTSVATVITQVVVAADDPAFQHPTKPVGMFYAAAEAERRRRELGWTMVEDAARGWRRVVPSPEPQAIVEIDAIRSLVADGYIVIAAGGGGIPVVERDGQLIGVEAVIDKDLASALLAMQLHAETMIISTDVDQVYLDFRTPERRGIRQISAAEAEHYLAAGHFPPGSMGPKIRAATRFLRGGGRLVLISCPERLLDAMQGRAGTRIVP